MTLFVGTSGWQYKHWKDRFYPPGVSASRELEYYAERFQIVEVNATFYRLPSRETFERWSASTPKDFRFVIKASRFLTHVKRLKDPEEPVARLMEHADPLLPKMAGVLIQLPPNLQRDDERLEGVLAAFPARTRLAVEFRHPSWFTDDVHQILFKHRAAFCLADSGSRLVTPVWRTADWSYLRFHAGSAQPSPCYGRQALASRIETLARIWGRASDQYVFFNNDPAGCAVRDARRFGLQARHHGFEVTRLPGTGEIRVG